MARTFPEFAPRVVPAVIEYLLHAQVVPGASCQGYSMMCWCIVQCPCMNETFSKIQPILRDGNWQRINSRKRTTTARNFHLSMKRFFLEVEARFNVQTRVQKDWAKHQAPEDVYKQYVVFDSKPQLHPFYSLLYLLSQDYKKIMMKLVMKMKQSNLNVFLYNTPRESE